MKQGLIRHVGITAHSDVRIVEVLEEFYFDMVPGGLESSPDMSRKRLGAISGINDIAPFLMRILST